MRLFSDLCSKALARLVIAIVVLIKAASTIVDCCCRGDKGFISSNKLKSEGSVIRSSNTNSVSTNIKEFPNSEYV